MSEPQPKVLIIDDTPTNIETLIAVLEGEYELSVANSGAQAQGLLAKGHHPDLILLDIMMPDMDGIEVCAAIKRDPLTRDIPVIFVTARTDPDSEAQGLESGAVDFIHKPITKEIVRARVKLHLEIMRQRRELEALNQRLAHSLNETRQANERLTHLAQHDTLTDLPNRMLFFDRVETALARSKRNHTMLALMFIDLDKFKPINDTWGHAVGDQLLYECARRMQHCVRASDSVGRIGGDEFVVLLSEITREADAVAVAEKIRHALNQSFNLAGQSLFITPSIGIAIAPTHGNNEVELAKNADCAMYAAKKAGRNNVQLFQPPKKTVGPAQLQPNL